MSLGQRSRYMEFRMRFDLECAQDAEIDGTPMFGLSRPVNLEFGHYQLLKRSDQGFSSNVGSVYIWLNKQGRGYITDLIKTLVHSTIKEEFAVKGNSNPTQFQ